jgi:hypothetical protein
MRRKKMRRYLTTLVALLVAVAIAMPAFAAIEFKYGGQFRARIISQDNILDGRDDRIRFLDREDVTPDNPGGLGRLGDDNVNRIDQRLRLYFSFIASKNLQVVTKFEMGDTVWGQGDAGAGEGGRVAADQRILELKNAYLDFMIPNTNVNALIGIQGIVLLNSWILDDDFSAAVFKTKFDPLSVSVGYIAAQNEPDDTVHGYRLHTNDADRIDTFFLNLDYACPMATGTLSASLVGLYQYGHETVASISPFNLGDEGLRFAARPANAGFGVAAFPGLRVEDNHFFDLGLNVGYKMDWMSAYVNFAKNFGSVKIADQEVFEFEDREVFNKFDYEGWMVDAGANFFCGPYTFNVGGFYTSGMKLDDFFKPEAGVNVNDLDQPFQQEEVFISRRSSDLKWFTYPLATTKYFSEIMGGGILDNMASLDGNFQDFAFPQVNGFGQWRGYPAPFNIWTLTAGAAWQVLENTKLSASYWYFSTSEKVFTQLEDDFRRGRNPGSFSTGNDLGHELNLYLTQKVVDGLTLDLVAAYMFTGEAYNTATDGDDDVYELGARLQWNF